MMGVRLVKALAALELRETAFPADIRWQLLPEGHVKISARSGRSTA
jgi:hypothetical protein